MLYVWIAGCERYVSKYEIYEYRSTGVPEYRSTGVPEYRSTGVPEYRSTGVPEYRSTGVPEYRSTCIIDKDIIKLIYLIEIHFIMTITTSVL